MQFSSVGNKDAYTLQELVNGQEKSTRKVTGGVDGGVTINSTGDTSGFDPKSDQLGQDDFLNLLITQLRYQDPLEPQADTEFIAQLAQFSSLESNKNLEGSMENLATDMRGFIQSQQQASNATSTSLIGKTARVEVSKMEYTGDVVQGSLHVDRADGKGYLAILDGDGKGVFLQEIDASKSADKDIKFTWDGRDDDGNQLPSGTYTFSVVSNTAGMRGGFLYEEGVVTGVRYGDNGSTMLDIGTGSHDLGKLVQVIDPALKGAVTGEKT